MTTLVIIGNGFDIWNRLPTSYWHFHEQYYSFLEEHVLYFDEFCGDDSEWANFEESLGSFNQENFHENAVLQPSIEDMADYHTLLYGFEDEITIKKDELVDDITNTFKDWISSVDVNKAKQLIQLPTSYKFINFNYTTTLQDVYGIPDDNILHIHGKVKGNIIFGHGNDSDNNSSKADVESYEPWFDESQSDVSSVYGVFHKPVNEILDRCRVEIEGYGNVTDIIVIGHSINDIDIPYIRCILDAYPNAKWQNYNYEDEGIDAVSETHDKLIDAGVPKEKLESNSSEVLKTIYSVAWPHRAIK